MTEHHCLHEAEIATLKSKNTDFQEDLSEIKQGMRDLLACVKGNGEIGLATRIALVEQTVGTKKENSKSMKALVVSAIGCFLYIFADAVMWFLEITKLVGG